ncbi:hypothetical protein BDZ97DRAFT_1678838, partial [Flammula alnicola]
LWDIYSYPVKNPNKPFPQATYMLGVRVHRKEGYLEQNSELCFTLYMPQLYMPIASGEFFFFSS